MLLWPPAALTGKHLVKFIFFPDLASQTLRQTSLLSESPNTERQREGEALCICSLCLHFPVLTHGTCVLLLIYLGSRYLGLNRPYMTKKARLNDK